MIKLTVGSGVVILLATLLTGAAAQAGKEGTPHKFQVTLTAKISLEKNGKPLELSADTQYLYTWQQAGERRTLRFQSLQIRLAAQGITQQESFMNREKYVNTAGGKTEEITVDQMPEAQQQRFRDAFGGVVATLQVDANGKEIKRTLSDGPGAKMTVGSGMVSNTLLFHPPYYPNQDEWRGELDFQSPGSGQIRVPVTYTRAGKGKSNNLYKVTGQWNKDAIVQPGKGTTLREVRYVVQGEQVFDPTLREWVSGKLTLNISQIQDDGKSKTPMKASMELKFDRVAGMK